MVEIKEWLKLKSVATGYIVYTYLPNVVTTYGSVALLYLHLNVVTTFSKNNPNIISWLLSLPIYDIDVWISIRWHIGLGCKSGTKRSKPSTVH